MCERWLGKKNYKCRLESIKNFPCISLTLSIISISRWICYYLYSKINKTACIFTRFQYLQHRQAVKKISRNRYPFESNIIPAAIEMTARPKFWIDCMLGKRSQDYNSDMEARCGPQQASISKPLLHWQPLTHSTELNQSCPLFAFRICSKGLKNFF